MVIAVDFDGVIRNWDNTMVPGAKDGISSIREQGHKVLIHSCNSPKFIRKWLDDHDIRCDWIWGEDGREGSKPQADVYLDDRGLRFISWDQSVEAIDEMALPEV